MDKKISRNLKDIEEYRTKIFKAKEEYRKELAKLPFGEKLRIASELYEFGIEFKKAKRKIPK